jgi:5-methylcytosine-specific restriction endonuclease McrA
MNRPCIDCNRLTRKTRCNECNRIKNRLRPTPAQRGYGYEWQKISKAFRKENPYCFKCGTTVDLTTDHVIPLAKNGTHHWSNLQTLCRKCNSIKGSK